MYSFDPNKNSILSVTSSVLRHYGIETEHSSMDILEESLEGCRNIIVMLFDGLGMNAVKKHLPRDSFLVRNLSRSINSVFPPTTVAATATVMSGKAVCEHGRLGYYQYFEEAGDNVSIFNNEMQSTGKVLEGDRLSDVCYPIKCFTETVRENSQDIHTLVLSPVFGNICKTLDEMCGKILEFSEKDGKHLIYSYWDNPDRDMHIYGVESNEVRDVVLNIDSVVGEMYKNLPEETALVIIADHGLIDTQWLDLNDYPVIASMLEMEPTMERRTVSLFAKKGMENRFSAMFNELFGDSFILMKKEQFLSSGLLGEGASHRRLSGSIGNYVAVATGELSIAIEIDDRNMKACHAGLTQQEVEVPLIIARK